MDPNFDTPTRYYTNRFRYILCKIRSRTLFSKLASNHQNCILFLVLFILAHLVFIRNIGNNFWKNSTISIAEQFNLQQDLGNSTTYQDDLEDQNQTASNILDKNSLKKEIIQQIQKELNLTSISKEVTDSNITNQAVGKAAEIITKKYEEISIQQKVPQNDPTKWPCPFDHPDKNKLSTNATNRHINVRPDKYLFSMSPFGPNNQFRGFRDNIILAYYLNRTVVLPDFVKHGTDASYTSTKDDISANTQNANEKVNLYELSKFINIVTMQELSNKNICTKPQQFDVAYYARFELGPGPFHQLKTYDYLYNFNLTNDKNYGEFLKKPNLAKIQIFPYMAKNTNNRVIGDVDSKDKLHTQIYLKMNNESIQAAYGDKGTQDRGQGTVSDKQCAIYVMPFRNLDWFKPVHNITPSFERSLSIKMLLSTPRPKSVTELVREFSAKYLKTYIAMHWRYDIDDFGHHCERDLKDIARGGYKSNKSERGVCKLLLNGHFNGTRIGENMEKWLESRNDTRIDQGAQPGAATSNHFKPIYIAAPMKEKNFVSEIKNYFSSKNLGKIIFGSDLTNFIENKFKNSCSPEKFDDQIHDFISQAEQEICLKSKIFIESVGSSWSMGVRHERIVHGVHYGNDIKNKMFWVKKLHHGLIPNLYACGSRYNARDATWFWSQSLILFIEATKNDPILSKKFLTKQFLSEMKASILEIILQHEKGINFIDDRQDDQMSRNGRKGFEISAGIDPETGFIVGGNKHNCGTWMDKMGENGVPATSRDGAAIELTVGFYSLLKYCRCSSTLGSLFSPEILQKFQNYENKISKNFQQKFWNPEDKFYYDCLMSENGLENRPNQFIAMNFLFSEDLFNLEHRKNAILTCLKSDMLGKYGLATLSPKDSRYSPNYSGGDNYHQGPEWVWVCGCFLRELVKLSKTSHDQISEIDKLAINDGLSEYLGNYLQLMYENDWPGLPELTNKNGDFCERSCMIQAWSNGLIVQVLEELL